MDILSLNQWVEKNLLLVIAINYILVIILLGYIFHIKNKLKQFRYLFKGNEGKDLETVLLNVSEKIHVFNNGLSKLENRVTNNQIREEKHFQNWSLVRFKAFQNTGGDQSFALAVLDGSGDGYVMSSIFGREESRVYCKAVQNGSSPYPLSDEEKEAIEKALGKTGK